VTTWMARIAVIAVFLLGAVSGGTAVHMYTLRLQRDVVHSPSPLASILVVHLARELDLDSDQKERVRAVVMEIREETLRDDDIQTHIMPKVMDVLDKGEERIRPILTDEQRGRFDALVAERREMLDEMSPKDRQRRPDASGSSPSSGEENP
jgi:hypothetical protein